MLQYTEQVSRHNLSDYWNGTEDDPHDRVTSVIPDNAAFNTEFDVSSAIQVGHQLALIGDELNRTYHGTLQKQLIRFARTSIWRMAASICQTSIYNNFKSIINWSSKLVNNSWITRILAYGGWIPARVLKNTYQSLLLAVLFITMVGIILKFGLYS